MKREDIIRMAREAGMEQDGDNFFSPSHEEIDVHITDLERFAALVAAAEREACAKVCEEVESRADGLWDKFAYPDDQGMAMGARQCIDAIRARSNT